MANIAAKIGMKLITMAVGVPVGIVTKKAVERTWVTARPEEPPRKPSDPGVRWRDAVGWAVLSAVGVVTADLLTRRGADAAWRRLTGKQPPRSKGKSATASTPD